jgi:nicotinamidase/pyrazinamidase
MSSKALIIIDVQNDFCPGGALPVKEGDQIVPLINRVSPLFERVVATQDWHPIHHTSFAINHGKSVNEVITIGTTKQVLWPVHCVPGTYGAEFHKGLDLQKVNVVFHKGMNPKIDSYSAFLDNDKNTETGLHYYLKGLGVTDVFLCGLATDYCVYYSAIDALRFGLRTTVILDATRAINIPPGSFNTAISDMLERGIRMVDHEHVLD